MSPSPVPDAEIPPKQSPFIRWLPWGVSLLLAAILFAVPWDYCVDGNGYGFPMAWLHPGHGEWGAIVVDERHRAGAVIDVPNLAGSLLLWFAISLGVWFWVKWRLSRVSAESGKEVASKGE